MRTTSGSLRDPRTQNPMVRSATRCRRCRRCTPPRRGRRPSVDGARPRRSGAGGRRAPCRAATTSPSTSPASKRPSSLAIDSSIAGCSSCSRFTVPARRGARSMISSYRPPGFSVTMTCWSNASRTPTMSFVTCPLQSVHASGGRRADRHLQLHDGVVQGLAAFPGLAERRRQLVLRLHHCTLRARRDDAQTAEGPRSAIRSAGSPVVPASLRTIREPKGRVSYVHASRAPHVARPRSRSSS